MGRAKVRRNSRRNGATKTTGARFLRRRGARVGIRVLSGVRRGERRRPCRALRRWSLAGGNLQPLPLQVLDGLLLRLLDRGDERALAGQRGLKAVVEVLVGGVDRRYPLPRVVDALVRLGEDLVVLLASEER